MEIKSLTRAELEVLLALFETPSRSIKGYMLHKKYPLLANRMIQEKWLIEDGILPSVEDDGWLAPVEWNQERKQFEYFSHLLGWTKISSKRLKLYKINMPKVTYWLWGLFNIHPSSQSAMLYKDVLVYLGVTKVDDEFINIYLCSRLNNMENREAINKIIKERKGQGKSLLVIGKLDSKIPLELSPNFTEVKFESLLLDRVVCQVDRDRLLFLTAHQRQRMSSSSQLSFSADYRMIHWQGATYKFTKLQADIFEALWKAGGYAHKDYLQAQANTNTEIHRAMRNNNKGKFSPHPLMGSLIINEKNGYYRLNQDIDMNLQEPLFDKVL